MKIGDIVIDKNDRVGYIKDIYKCSECNRREFNEPEILWIDDPDEYDYISDIEYKNGLEKRFKRIGDVEYKQQSNKLSDITVKTVDNIVINAPKHCQMEMKFTSEDRYINHWLYKKEQGEKLVKIVGLTSDDRPFAISFCGDYELEVEF